MRTFVNLQNHVVSCLLLLSPVLSFSLSELFQKPWVSHPEDNDPRANKYLYQGDIILPFNRPHKGLGTRHAIDLQNIWHFGIVPYRFGRYFPAQSKGIVEASMRGIEKVSCVRFVEKDSDKMVELHARPQGCYSAIGVNKNKFTPINLEMPACNTTDLITHELLHSLGFWHEQQRPDRDRYVIVLKQNIKKDFEGQFGKNGPFKNPTENMPYDIKSLMHYSSFLFTKNGQPTIIKKNERNNLIYPAQRMSDLDIKKLNALYEQQCKLRRDFVASQDPYLQKYLIN